MRARIASLSTKKGRNNQESSRSRSDQRGGDQDFSSSPSPDGKAGRHRERNSGNTTNDDSEDEGADDNDSGLDQSGTEVDVQVGGVDVTGVADGNKRQNREKARKDREIKARRMFNSLPTDQQEYIWNILVSFVADVVEGHPLSSSISLHLKQETVLEVSLQVREIMASLLVLPMNEINVGRGGAKSGDLPLVSLDVLYSVVSKALSSTPGLKIILIIYCC